MHIFSSTMNISFFLITCLSVATNFDGFAKSFLSQRIIERERYRETEIDTEREREREIDRVREKDYPESRDYSRVWTVAYIMRR